MRNKSTKTKRGTERSGTPDEKYIPHRREGDAMDLLFKLTHNKRMTIASSSVTSGNLGLISEKEKTPAASQVISHKHHNNEVESNSGKSKLVKVNKFRTNETTEEWYEELSDDHTSAFKEVFDMLDSTKTGTLNADTLYEGLRRVDSEITRAEVEDVLKVLDKDGNGVIDFDEFLMHITSVDEEGEQDEGKSSKSSKYTKRQKLFFSALRKFDRKSDLSKLQANDGLRLIGLSDKQLKLKLKKIQRAAKSINSPYAKPFDFVIPCEDPKRQNVRKTIGLKASLVLQEIDKPTNKLYFDPLRIVKSQKDLDKDILKLVTDTMKTPHSKFSKMPKISEVLKLQKHDRIKTATGDRMQKCDDIAKKVGRRKHNGWIIPRAERDKVPLPVLKLSGLTIKDLPDIREKVKKLVDDYHANLRKAFVRTACEHWVELSANHRGSKKSFEHLREVYRVYLPNQENESIVKYPWIPGAFSPVHNNRCRTAPEPDNRKS